MNINDLSKGDPVYHKEYGTGLVVKKEDKGVTVKFFSGSKYFPRNNIKALEAA